ncbi:hypothetical protein VMCG_05760 [Cytospora schulzeri]|uniref:Uncharacterized protein n=1 Tax=Cytospora schulzeri TaxID=448051 RepID=A0A423WI52_9PEZI|nr:hypothetical protein VMCG_05760 [Valsa malicola]
MAKQPAKTWGFSSLPAELRLQILANTHLGPPPTGGYDSRFGTLQVRDGRIVPRHQLPLGPWDDPPSWTKCSSPKSHGTHQPQCQCRIIPTQLFTVSRQTSTEALEVFYTNLHLDLDPSSSVPFLRSLSPQNIRRLRRLTFTITPAQVEGWCNGAVASGYDAAMLESQVANPYWDGGAVKPPGDDGLYRRTWREVMALLAAHADLPRLALTVDMSGATWVYIEDTLMWDDPPDEIRPMFRFIYDMYIDVATALCELRGLGQLVVELSVFEQMKPWLEREVLGRESPEPEFEGEHERRHWEEVWKQPRWYQVAPSWHDGERRLEGSNYRPK